MLEQSSYELPKWHETTNPENSRTYHFSDGTLLTLQSVKRLAVGKSGTHRVECHDGAKYIVAPKWNWISLELKEWSF